MSSHTLETMLASCEKQTPAGLCAPAANRIRTPGPPSQHHSAERTPVARSVLGVDGLVEVEDLPDALEADDVGHDQRRAGVGDAVLRLAELRVGGRDRDVALFFFQAEDGIRDGHVTGVQTCALPISRVPKNGNENRKSHGRIIATPNAPSAPSHVLFGLISLRNGCRPKILPKVNAATSLTAVAKIMKRSEERRVGKECRARW